MLHEPARWEREANITNSNQQHKHWIIGGWHIAVNCLEDRWAWRVDDLVHSLDPITLEGTELPDMNTALLKALDVVAAFEGINATVEQARWFREARAENVLDTPSAWILDPNSLAFDDDEPLDWLDLPSEQNSGDLGH